MDRHRREIERIRQYMNPPGDRIDRFAAISGVHPGELVAEAERLQATYGRHGQRGMIAGVAEECGLSPAQVAREASELLRQMEAEGYQS